MEFFSSLPVNTTEGMQGLSLELGDEASRRGISDLLHKTVLAGGKRLRPLLTFLMGDLFHQSWQEMAPFARAIEMVHAASLAHDDVIDNATTRRGSPSINIEASNKKAILAGDYLLAQVIAELAASEKLELVKEMSKIIQGLSEGEWIQADAVISRQYSRQLIEEIAFLKTATVMSWCTFAPAVVSNRPVRIQEYCKALGQNIGIAFQLMDDTLDFSGDSLKDQHLDIKNGIVNSVMFEWFELNPQAFEKFKAGKNLEDFWNVDTLDAAIKRVKDRACLHLERAKDLLNIITKEDPTTNSEAIESLQLIIDYIEKRRF